MVGGSLFGQPLQEPALPESLPLVADGFFPTLVESPLLRGAYNARSNGGAVNGVGPDNRLQTATGIFPYEQSTSNFYERNPGVFANMDRALGVFLPHDAWTLESERLRHTALTFDANMGLLTRSFSPDLATIKAGPLYFDLLYFGIGAIWSDYNGNNGPQKTDGFISNVNTGVRGLLRITDTIYFSLAAQLMYLPGTNEFAFSLGNGSGSALVANLSYGDSIGPWSVMFYDNFSGRPGINFLPHTTEPGSDQAGRYYYGIRQSSSRTGNFYTQGGAFFSNRIGFSASRLVLGGQWRFWSQLNHVDFWRTFDFTNHSQREHLGLALGYEGSIIPFAPRFYYDAYSFDKLKSIRHQFGVRFTGRLTENINWTGGAGYGFATGSGSRNSRSGFLWHMQFSHTITAKTLHSLAFGEGFFANDYSNDAFTTRYLNYRISHSFARNLRASVFAQISDRENTYSVGSIEGGNSTSRAGGGATLTYQPLDFTSINASAVYNTSLKPANTYDYWVWRLSINQQLGMRLTGNIFYQYVENSSGPGSFSEHAIGVSLRRYF